MVFTLRIYIWRHNLVHRKYSFDFFFCPKWDLCVLTSSAKSMNRELSFVVRAQFWRGNTKEFAILVNRVFPTLLAAWLRQQYPCTWVKISFIVLKRKNISRFASFDRFFIPMEFDSSVEFWGAIRLALIVWPFFVCCGRRNVSEINEKAYNYSKSSIPLCCWLVFVKKFKKKKFLFCCLFYLFV